MNLARIVGNIWATRKDPSLEESKILIIQPLDKNYDPVGERIAAVDTVGSGPDTGEIVFFVSSKEAAIPMPNPLTPIDAAIVGIVDHIDPDPLNTDHEDHEGHEEVQGRDLRSSVNVRYDQR